MCYVHSTYIYKFYSNKYERKQLALYKEWEFEQNEIQAALGNVIDDFNSLKNINTALEQTICEQK